MSQHRICTVGVVGAGVMGTGIACHLASAGLDVLLVDIVPKGAPDAVPVSHPSFAAVRKARNAVAQGGLDKALALKPAPIHRLTDATRITLGNLRDDLAELGRCDWIVEAVTERLDIKNAVFDAIEAHRLPHTIVSSNTSGIPLATMAAARSAEFRKHFLITHFFNPVRYMRLLEIVAGADTDPTVVDRIAAFCSEELGKGVVHAKDTINFIANRIGVHDMMQAVQATFGGGYRIDEVDALFGEPMGRPKSAVFRTADVVGLDTLGHVAQNCHDNLQHDPSRGVFALHPVIAAMVAKGAIGQKAGAGFYRKVGADILVLDPAKADYVPQQKADLPCLEATKKVRDTGARIAAICASDDRGGRLAWQVVSHSLCYAAELLGEIADDVVSIDRAMRWGFNWQMGPFELWDALGVALVVARLQAEGRKVPQVALDLLAAGRTRFYADGTQTRADRSQAAVPGLPGLHLADVRAAGRVVAENASAQLLDLGDRVLCLAFRSKMNALDDQIIAMGWQALERIDRDGWAGLVVGNDGANFSVGANLGFIAQASAEGRWAEMTAAVQQFQNLFMAFKYSHAPVVAAPHGMTLGGGCEIAMHSARTVAAAETYMGLVEVGVGLLPGAGGTKELTLRALHGIPADTRADRVALLQRAFETIALAKVSTGAGDARNLAFLRDADVIAFDADRRIEVAKRVVLHLVAERWRPPARPDHLILPGAEGIAVFDMALYAFRCAGQATDHDCTVGHEIATVLCGGTAGGKKTEQDLLDLERESFLRLCGLERTRARIAHMLATGKPLRN
ncbi:MAG: enoyl-CoA hydratase/isomerase family protein [Deltaproteobacteria bacterium]|nr:enoyl-CoA hydratase/isomerase family protein [Deltaproteobacteria bacterium]